MRFFTLVFEVLFGGYDHQYNHSDEYQCSEKSERIRSPFCPSEVPAGPDEKRASAKDDDFRSHPDVFTQKRRIERVQRRGNQPCHIDHSGMNESRKDRNNKVARQLDLLRRGKKAPDKRDDETQPEELARRSLVPGGRLCDVRSKNGRA